MIRIGITGPNGFIAKHLAAYLRRETEHEIVPCPREAFDSLSDLETFVSRCDVIVHSAGVNRGEPSEVEFVNAQLAEQLVEACESAKVTPRFVFTSTTQRNDDNPYGRGKRRAEEILYRWANANNTHCTTLVIPNVYGAGSQPYYNSVVATFCHQLTHNEQPSILDDRTVEFIWINDLIPQIASEILSDESSSERRVTGETTLKVSELLSLLEEFRDAYFVKNVVPELGTPIRASLYSTFLSHIDLNDHRHMPPLHTDERGALCEVIKISGGGQVFFSTTKPGVTRGNHYHTRKVEWFCVVKGEATIRLRRLGEEKITEFHVSGERPEFISIPVLHTHSIENSGDTELLTMFWCNEIFDAADADTHFEKVA